MPFEVWDVVDVAAFPNQEDKKQTTARPAVILEDLQREVLICPVTKQVHQVAIYTYTIYVDKDSAEGRQMGLDFHSIIVLDRHEVLNKLRLRPTTHTCPQTIIDQIEAMMQRMRADGINI